MTSKKPPDINIVDLSKRREEKKQEELQIPDEIIHKLEDIVRKAKSGQLKSVIVNFDYELDETDTDLGNNGSLYYNRNQNGIELLGTIEIMKSQIFHMIYTDDLEDE